MITKTDRIILGIIIHSIRSELGSDIGFKCNGKTRRPVNDALPTQIAIYFCNQCFTGAASKEDLSSLFGAHRTYVIYSERAIQKRLSSNRTFQYMMRRIASEIEKRIMFLTDQ